jgi:hypothetical protein
MQTLPEARLEPYSLHAKIPRTEAYRQRFASRTESIFLVDVMAEAEISRQLKITELAGARYAGLMNNTRWKRASCTKRTIKDR